MQLAWGGAGSCRRPVKADYIVTCRRNCFDLIRIRVYAASNCASICMIGAGIHNGRAERMEKFCDELRWEREQRKISIEAICEETKISARHLLALEAGEYSELPGGVFRKGIVRSYLAALGLEESSWIARFEAHLRDSGAGDTEDWAEFAENVRRNRGISESGMRVRWMGVAMMAASLLVLGWCVWRFALHGRLL